MRSRAARLLLVLLAFACATPPPSDPDPAPPPLALGPAGSKPLAFMHVVTRIPAGTLLGIAHWRGGDDALDEIRASGSSERDKGFNVAITDLLREHGYTVLDEADAVFEPARTVQVRYQLAGVVHGVELDYAYERRPSHRAAEATGRASVEFELQVHDLVRRETIFRRTYRGHGVDVGAKPNPIVPAVVDAMRWALADGVFVAAVAEGGTDPAAGPGASIRIRRCPERTLALPSQTREAMQAIVVVQAGGLMGSGVIVSEEGHVVTAAHNVGEDTEPMVRLASGVQLPGELLRRDAAADVALLRLPGSGYACVSVVRGPSAPSEGSDLYAVNLGLSHPGVDNSSTVSRGVLSGYQTHDGRRYLQTDASVNPGSSGGPLLDRQGAVVGIVVEKIFGFGIEGLGFAVPLDEVERALGIDWE